MALQKREKTMLKVLAGIAVISAIVLYINTRPEQAVVSDIGEETTEEAQAVASGGSRRGGGGGGSRGGGGGGTQSAPKIKAETLASHASPDDCWVVIEDEVYDITGYLSSADSSTTGMTSFCGTFGFETGYLNQHISRKPQILQKSRNVGSFKG